MPTSEALCPGPSGLRERSSEWPPIAELETVVSYEWLDDDDGFNEAIARILLAHA